MSFNVTFTIRNTTEQKIARPEIRMENFRLDQDFYFVDVRAGGRFLGPYKHNASTNEWAAPGHLWFYPDGAYSPVILARTASMAVGLSYLYQGAAVDIADIYRIAPKLSQLIGANAGKLNLGYVRYTADASASSANDLLRPGQQERFTVAVRFAQVNLGAGQNGTEALTPYRDDFLSRFGPITYKGGRRPIYAFSPALSNRYAPDNLKSFREAETYSASEPTAKVRLDKHGWGEFRTAEFGSARYSVQKAVQDGFKRVLIWTPSGLYSQVNGVASPWNMPVEFITQMSQVQKDTLEDGFMKPLKRDHGVMVGFWRGRSSFYNPNYPTSPWDPAELRIREPNAPECWKNIDGKDPEMVDAWNRGVNLVGLDAFLKLPIWDRKLHMENLLAEYPYMRFVIEPMECDILHRIAPIYSQFSMLRSLLNNQPIQASRTARTSDITPVLANYLLPGHETWVAMDIPAELKETDEGPNLGVEYFSMAVAAGYTPIVRGMALPPSVSMPTPSSGNGTVLNGQWLLDEANLSTGTRMAADSSLNRNHAYASGAITTATEARFDGSTGPCAAFSGNGSINTPDDSALLDLDARESFTLSCWVKLPAGTGNPKYILSKGDTNQKGYALAAWAAQQQTNVPIQLILHDGSSRTVFYAGPITRDTWEHVAFAFDREAGEIRAYRNGLLQSTEPIPPGYGGFENASVFSIGGHNGGGHPFTGKLADICVWDYALNDDEVDALYQGN